MKKGIVIGMVLAVSVMVMAGTLQARMVEGTPGEATQLMEKLYEQQDLDRDQTGDWAALKRLPEPVSLPAGGYEVPVQKLTVMRARLQEDGTVQVEEKAIGVVK